MFTGEKRRKLVLAAVLVLLAVALVLGPLVAGKLRGSQSEGGFVVWGANNFGQTGTGTAEFEEIRPQGQERAGIPDVAQVVVGLNHSLALTKTGQVYGWGNNQFGQIGQGSAISFKTDPTQVAGLPKVVQIAASQDHSLALDADGRVWAWGLNISGQLGDGTNTDSAKPRRVPGMTGVQQVAAGYRMSLALKDDGSLWAWGGDCQLDSERGKSLRSTVEALAIDGSYSSPKTASAKTGGYAALQPEEDCINEAVVGIRSVTPRKLEGLPNLTTISAGFGHMLAIDAQGAVWAWGCNTYGQVGNGTVGRGTGANLMPAKVAGIADAVAVSAGFRHSLVLGQDGRLWAWGHNYSGELGTGVTEDQHPTPVRVTGLPVLREIAAGHDFSLAVSRTGDVYGWGNGNAWQFGRDLTVHRSPVRAWGLKDVHGLVAGGGHAAALVGAAPDGTTTDGTGR